MPEQTEQLRDLLARDGYVDQDVTLASGRRSAEYIDAKAVTYNPEAVEAVGAAVLANIIEHEVDAVGGLTIGADAIVSSVIHAANRAGLRIPGFIVRKESKKHGLQRQVEGVRVSVGARVAVVDDVVTSGGSVLKAVEALREEGVSVAVVVPLVDREAGAREAIESRGIEYRPVFTLSDIRSAAQAQKRLLVG